MPTDDERREVARRLRGPFDVIGQGRYVSLNGTLFGMQLLANSENELRAGARRLADLIEPQTSKQTNPRESSLSASLCDRDALLALADELERAIYFNCSEEREKYLVLFVERIREAVGA